MNTSRGLDWWAWQGLNLRPLRCQRSPVRRKWQFSAGFACFNTGTRVEHRGVPLRFYRAVTAHEQIGEIVEAFREGGGYLTNIEIARDYPVSDSLISRIRTGRSWQREAAQFGWRPAIDFLERAAA